MLVFLCNVLRARRPCTVYHTTTTGRWVIGRNATEVTKCFYITRWVSTRIEYALQLHKPWQQALRALGSTRYKQLYEGHKELINAEHREYSPSDDYEIVAAHRIH
ncbi:hypothetical protein HPB50_023644 [Hyalomma asiaticum]|uniref:Uncharacterized protein n=1 Tax=Hyalomma asiaticum TaxID=266040 RepID=A0ACB7T6S6_HYAAI|nr:hypothetical protein HPB50_023644 [Hyalomma asiaticum]